ncbi:hypothetical protein G0Q06_03170 [Puniceicoccales bacterium CK1056]|uniref:Uncharacterized protein n=1 Tax=Oceanipulchritudo coccoides TaxID=2706888 RepID=A0A6B2LZT9_9BACT|nr:hypothetical protein [Oceanipulchritudo coccoides]NDV61444.1 hypothetical protein [Oceanipulchritudo coccoides]
MKWEKLNNWIQIIGMLGVIGSLVFVGLQLKQSQEIAIAAQYQARLESASSHYTSILQSNPALHAIGTDILSDMLADPSIPEDLKAWASAQPVEELAVRLIGAIIALKSHDNVYFQYQSGFIDQESWDALCTQLKIGLDDQRTWMKSIYLENPMVWRESYRELIEELIE